MKHQATLAQGGLAVLAPSRLFHVLLSAMVVYVDGVCLMLWHEVFLTLVTQVAELVLHAMAGMGALLIPPLALHTKVPLSRRREKKRQHDMPSLYLSCLLRPARYCMRCASDRSAFRCFEVAF